MSLFDDDDPDEDWYYDPDTEFQRRVLKHADAEDEHPLAYLAIRLSKSVDAMEQFVDQDPLLSRNERIAITSDIEEAQDAMARACQLIPKEVTEDGHDHR